MESAAKQTNAGTTVKTADAINDLPETSKKGKKKKGKKRKLDDPSDIVENGFTNECDISEPSAQSSQEINAKSITISNEISKQDFTILGSKKRAKSQFAKRVLPHWLTHPEIVNADLSSGSNLVEIENLLDSKLIQKLKADGFDKLFPVQVRILSWLLKCDEEYKIGRWVRDTCVSMPTGSGKV